MLPILDLGHTLLADIRQRGARAADATVRTILADPLVREPVAVSTAAR